MKEKEKEREREREREAGSAELERVISLTKPRLVWQACGYQGKGSRNQHEGWIEIIFPPWNSEFKKEPSEYQIIILYKKVY